MKLALKPEVRKLIEERVDSGRYSSAEDVVSAAIVALQQQEQFGDFDAGELGQLLAEAEKSIQQHGTLDGDEAFEARRKQRQRQRKPAR